MDDIGIATLWNEMHRDCQVAREAVKRSASLLAEETAGAREACAFHLARLFNIIEQLSQRVAKAFENNIDDEKGWHAELIRRLSIPIGGVRPALFPAGLHQPLQELRQFRHVFNHAYEIEFMPEKLRLLVGCAQTVAPQMESLCRGFIETVATMHGLAVPPECLSPDSER